MGFWICKRALREGLCWGSWNCGLRMLCHSLRWVQQKRHLLNGQLQNPRLQYKRTSVSPHFIQNTLNFTAKHHQTPKQNKRAPLTKNKKQKQTKNVFSSSQPHLSPIPVFLTFSRHVHPAFFKPPTSEPSTSTFKKISRPQNELETTSRSESHPQRNLQSSTITSNHLRSNLQEVFRKQKPSEISQQNSRRSTTIDLLRWSFPARPQDDNRSPRWEHFDESRGCLFLRCFWRIDSIDKVKRSWLLYASSIVRWYCAQERDDSQ